MLGFSWSTPMPNLSQEFLAPCQRRWPAKSCTDRQERDEDERQKDTYTEGSRHFSFPLVLRRHSELHDGISPEPEDLESLPMSVVFHWRIGGTQYSKRSPRAIDSLRESRFRYAVPIWGNLSLQIGQDFHESDVDMPDRRRFHCG